MYRKYIALSILVALSALLFSCKTSLPEPDRTENVRHQTELEQLFTESNVFSESLTGFVLYDPDTDSVLHNRDGNRYFTPASNTKILTLYASLNALPDTLPSLKYEVRNDTLYFHGTGDPAFLNPNFDFTGAYDFLSGRDEVLVYDDSRYDDDHFGSGWSWNWYPASYAPEKSPFPIYGNMMRLQARQVALIMLDEDEPVKPAYFERFIKKGEWNGDQSELVTRNFRDNQILYVPKSDTARQERNIPFVYNTGLIANLLADTLGRDVGIYSGQEIEYSNVHYATQARPLYERMMVVSDNMIAEQLMLMISEQEFGVMNTTRAINFAQENYLEDLPDRPRWVDGSGLTRYNLITPMSTVVLLEKLYTMLGHEETLALMPIGGVRGTISGRYRAPEGQPPFVYAKTGTLSNNTSLSGYLFTDSGRRLTFSFHNNNFVVSNNVIRNEMDRVLQYIRQNY
ncbi:D-alanyl-D-alanine carboxypeptidase/D-alanyl-D-alanine-endopeptidase [Rhodohalobacter sp. 8-1]|uniref:D-alanyl-D-alanine carboxypeptidase/D-alanyl-D-alanine-endopeptidase n=1 Tax=Rhodohalobacter sp. 8-1 TaxID=3131972 RepID=UPI0030EE4008